MYMLSEAVRLLKTVMDGTLWSAIAIIIGPNLLVLESENHDVMEMIRMTAEIAEVRVHKRKLTITRNVRQRLPMAVLQVTCLLRARRQMTPLAEDKVMIQANR